MKDVVQNLSQTVGTATPAENRLTPLPCRSPGSIGAEAELVAGGIHLLDKTGLICQLPRVNNLEQLIIDAQDDLEREIRTGFAAMATPANRAAFQDGDLRHDILRLAHPRLPGSVEVTNRSGGQTHPEGAQPSRHST